MKIGLIGNMNNNNFALMRYFRDLGADAHLLLYSNDGKGSLSHFKPESDTWEIEKWSSFIHQTNIPNSPIAAMDPPFSWVMGLKSIIRSKLLLQEVFVRQVSKEHIKEAYEDYDSLISSGITPATLLRINRTLDIFYPYSSEAEFLFHYEFTSRIRRANILLKKILKTIQNKQAKGIRLADHVLSFNSGSTAQALEKIGVTAKRFAVPMVYSNEKLPAEPPNESLANAARIVSNASFSVLHHARLLWRNNGSFSDTDWQDVGKNSHWFIGAFADLVKLRTDSEPHLFILEYGPDIEITKELVTELGISEYVTFLPKMERKEIMWLLSIVTVGIGEFYNIPKMIWGGTGWEVLASGKPLIQGFNFEDGEFNDLYGYPPPPMLPVKNRDDILVHLLSLMDYPAKASDIGEQSKKWFDTYNGAGLAKQWLDLLVDSPNRKSNLNQKIQQNAANG